MIALERGAATPEDPPPLQASHCTTSCKGGGGKTPACFLLGLTPVLMAADDLVPPRAEATAMFTGLDDLSDEIGSQAYGVSRAFHPRQVRQMALGTENLP
jgi:hypothetical protein